MVVTGAELYDPLLARPVITKAFAHIEIKGLGFTVFKFESGCNPGKAAPSIVAYPELVGAVSRGLHLVLKCLVIESVGDLFDSGQGGIGRLDIE